LTLPQYEIVDYRAFQGVPFFCISPKNLLRDFSYSLNVAAKRLAKERSGFASPTSAA